MKRFLLVSVLFFMIAGILHAADIVPGGVYKITSIGNNKAMSLKHSSLDNTASVVAWTQTEVNSQRWYITKDASGEYCQISNAYTGVALRTSGSIINGTKLTLGALDDTATSKWQIIAAEDADCYYISSARLLSNENIYMEVVGTADGSDLLLYKKASGADLENQIWKIEAVEADPNYFTSTMRDAIMNGWKTKYYKRAGTGYIIGNGGFWGDAEMFETILDAYETTGEEQYHEMFKQLYANFTSRMSNDWMGNEYNDDIAWIVIASVRAYLMFGDRTYLNNAKNNFDKMYARALQPYGLLRWKQHADNWNGTNSCINGPAEVAACYLAIATGTDSYYTKAKDLYDLQRQYLYVPSTGQVYDSFGEWEDDAPTGYNHWASTYNQGTYLGAALMLYDRYGDEMYKEDAHKIVEYTQNHLCNKNGIISVCGKGADLPGFKGILQRYLRRYVVDLGATDIVPWMQKNALHCYNNRNSEGIVWTAWWEKTTENYVFEDYDFKNDPFGCSTAVSAAFNSPLNRDVIYKDAFGGIEAENFNYIKSCYTTTSGAMTYMDHIRGSYWLGYNLVDFGNNRATKAEFKVGSVDFESTIEIRLGSPTGTLLGTANIPVGAAWTTISCDIDPIGGVQNIYLVFLSTNQTRNILCLDNFKFLAGDGDYLYTDVMAMGTLSSSHDESGLRNIADKNVETKYYTELKNGSEEIWIQYHTYTPTTLQAYAFVSADNNPEYDPQTWKLQASNDGTTWVDLDSQSAQSFDARYQKKTYQVSPSAAYKYFRVSITERKGNDPYFQLAEWQLYGTAVSGYSILNDGGSLSAEYKGGLNALTDRNSNTKYAVNGSNFWVQYDARAIYKINRYSITSADNSPESDPVAWALYASTDGSSWDQIDRRVGEKFSYRNTTQAYPVSVEGYRYFKLHVLSNNGGSTTQIAELQLYGDPYFGKYSNDVTYNGGQLSSSQDDEGAEALDVLTDKDGNTVYTLNLTESAWVQYKSATPVQLRGYTFIVGGDASKYPTAITLQGSNNNSTWTNIDKRSRLSFDLKHTRLDYSSSKSEKYIYFRFLIEGAEGATQVDIAEIELHGTGLFANSYTSNGGVITAQYEGINSGEGVAKLIDNNADSKYCVANQSALWVQYESSTPIKPLSYSITSANDSPNRDPKTWVLEASNDGIDWVTVDERKNQTFLYRYVTQYYSCEMDQAYTYFRLDITENNGENTFQFAEWQLLDAEAGATDVPQINTNGIEINVYPNPVVDYVMIDVNVESQVHIYNITGNLVHAQSLLVGRNQVDLPTLESGIYILKVQGDDVSATKKILKR